MLDFSMDKIRAATPVEDANVKTSRPWIRAIMSGAVFGGLAAAAANWLALHSQTRLRRHHITFGRQWLTGVAGVASGAVAMYSVLRPAEDAPKGVDNDGPSMQVQAETVEHGSKVNAPLPSAQRAL